MEYFWFLSHLSYSSLSLLCLSVLGKGIPSYKRSWQSISEGYNRVKNFSFGTSWPETKFLSNSQVSNLIRVLFCSHSPDLLGLTVAMTQHIWWWDMNLSVWYILGLVYSCVSFFLLPNQMGLKNHAKIKLNSIPTLEHCVGSNSFKFNSNTTLEHCVASNSCNWSTSLKMGHEP